MQNFEKLSIWQRASKLTTEVYEATQSFPDTERYGLTRQIRRSSVSIAANIAEGAGRDTKVDFARMLKIARGEASELQSHLIISSNLGFLDGDSKSKLVGDISDIRRMITGFIKSLERARAPERGVEIGL